jgi:hypothetical protein
VSSGYHDGRFSQAFLVPSGKYLDSTSIVLLPLSSKSLPIHYSPIGATQSEIPHVQIVISEVGGMWKEAAVT